MRDRTIERVDEIMEFAWRRSYRAIDLDGLGFWDLLYRGCVAAESYILGDYTEGMYQEKLQWLKTRWAARARRTAGGGNRVLPR